jgi:ribosomal protein L25 (general stress protein Ctc)
MNNADRAERIKTLVKFAAGVLRRNGEAANLVYSDGSRVRAWDYRHNALSLAYRVRVDVADRPATLIVKYDGKKVLIASWTTDGWSRRSYAPGPWENVLRRYDRMPATAGPSPAGRASPRL